MRFTSISGDSISTLRPYRPPTRIPEAPKIILQGDLADLRVEHRHIDGWGGGWAAGREDLDGAGEQLLAPRADLVRVELEALGELGQRGIAFQRGERHLGLEGGGVIPTGTTGQDGS